MYGCVFIRIYLRALPRIAHYGRYILYILYLLETDSLRFALIAHEIGQWRDLGKQTRITME
jgi:hypothetical protein